MIYVGYDSREADAYEVCVRSLGNQTVAPLLEAHLRGTNLYTRRHEKRGKQLWDPISNAPMSTEFAITRFLVPFITEARWALYCDCDFLFRDDVLKLYALADSNYAVQVVKHVHTGYGVFKMDGQKQSWYPRKNWSSLILWNRTHPAHQRLTLKMVNTFAGRDLHRFCWLTDNEIGELPLEWNWLPGYSDPKIIPKAVHFTNGVPSMPGHENDPYADEWRKLA